MKRSVLRGMLCVCTGLWACATADGLTIDVLTSFSDFNSTLVAIEDFESPLDDRLEFTFDSTAVLYPTNSNQIARSGLSFLGETGNNMPLFVEFHEDVYEVGFYAGNDDINLWGFEQWFHLDAYNPNGDLLTTITVSANVNDAIDTFVGLRSDEVLGSVGIRMGGVNPFATPTIAIDDFGVGFEPAPTGVVPEPSSLSLLGAGFAVLTWRRLRRRPS